jgi:hypothetical protein
MVNFFNRHLLPVTATVVLVACLSGFAIDANHRQRSDFASSINSNLINSNLVLFNVGWVSRTANEKPSAGMDSPAFESDIFEAPFRLKVGDQPLNNAARQMYPSPAMFDIDRDGQLELVVGDIFGSLNIYENLANGKSDPVWSSHIPLKGGDGEKIKVSNW